MPEHEREAFARSLEAALGRAVERDVPLSRYSTYRLGGPAALFLEARTTEDLAALASALRDHPYPVLVVGNGSNLLVADAGVDAIAVHLAGTFEEVAVEAARVTAGGGVSLPVLARRTAAAGRSGLEFYVGIPGTVGGAVRMNAGGHGRETADVLARAWVLHLARLDAEPGPREVTVADLHLGYRRSAITADQIVVRAQFLVGAGDPSACEGRIDDVVRWRRTHQPGGSNAGSVFTNPTGDSAGRLIDACGLKGHRVGGARVSEKHANFFQAEPGAVAADVRRLVVEVQRRVEEVTGIRLVPELTLVGFDSASLDS